jgi:hydrogenase/urease accessory protein HupE
LGHSITLMLATLGYTSASAAWVEPAIAASIGVSALLNLYPQRWLRTEVLAGVFGLVHGYGFAGLLIEAAAPSGLLGWALGGFNLGVEAGQLIAVSAWLIVSQPLVASPWYDRWVVRAGSWLLLALATFWFLQRTLPVGP